MDMKKLITILAVGVLALVGCGSSAEVTEDVPGASAEATGNQTTEPVAAPTTEEAPPAEPLDLTGHWKQVNSATAEESWMEAQIADGVVEVHLVYDGGDTKSLFWAGTYLAPTEPGESYSWESQNDHTKTDGSILGSSSETKTFTYADGQLSWEFSMMGTTSVIRAERL